MSNRLLMYGYDEILLDTRCSILAVSGPAQCTVVKLQRLRDVLEEVEEPYLAMVVCHTIPVAERTTIAALAAKHRKPILQIEGFILPTELLHAVHGLLRSEASP